MILWKIRIRGETERRGLERGSGAAQKPTFCLSAEVRVEKESGEWRHGGGGDQTRLVMEQLRLVRGDTNWSQGRADHFENLGKERETEQGWTTPRGWLQSHAFRVDRKTL